MKRRKSSTKIDNMDYLYKTVKFDTDKISNIKKTNNITFLYGCYRNTGPNRLIEKFIFPNIKYKNVAFHSNIFEWCEPFVMLINRTTKMIKYTMNGFKHQMKPSSIKTHRIQFRGYKTDTLNGLYYVDCIKIKIYNPLMENGINCHIKMDEPI